MKKSNLRITIERYLLQNSNKLKINSKEIRKNDVFVAMKGTNTHGCLYIDDAINNGAKYIICDKKIRVTDNKKILLVNNSLNFLYKIAVNKRNKFKGKVIGITGSIGKTSVKENLYFFFIKSL